MKAIPDCAGLVPVLVSVKIQVGGGPVVDRGRCSGLGQLGATVFTTTH